MKNCINCKINIDETANFCTGCGHKQLAPTPKIKTCIDTNCGNKLELSAHFCDECGCRQSSSEQMENESGCDPEAR